MLFSGILFDVGVILITAAWSLWILILARVLLGCAIAFASVAVTLYNSEMAPAHIRGRLNQLFQLILSLGVLLAQAINIGTARIYPWGWRLSMAAAGLPSIVLTLGGLLLPDTPNSLLDRGKAAEARAVLVRVRGTEDVEEELEDIRAAIKQAALVVNPYRTILKRSYLPQLLIPISVQLFHQWTGINSVTFFAPQLFESLGMQQSTALVATVIIGAANHMAVYVSIYAADIFGRRMLFIQGGVQMMCSLIVLAAVVGTAGPHLWVAWFCLIFLCSYTVSFNWSWAPMSWLYSTEVQPLETRAAGQSIATFVYLFFSFVIGQTYLSMLCTLRWGLFILFACFCGLAVITVYFFYPETKGLPLEDAPNVFKHHWFWRRFSQLQPTVYRQKDQQLLHISPSALDSSSNGMQHHAQSAQATEGAQQMLAEHSRSAVSGNRSGVREFCQTRSKADAKDVRHFGHEPHLEAGAFHAEATSMSDGYEGVLVGRKREPAFDDPFWS